MTNAEVAEAFAAGRPGHSLNLNTDGRELWSYALCVARRVGGVVHVLAHDRLVKPSGAPSITTRQHVSALWVPLHAAGVESRRVDAL
jgi:hypothetical protein